MQYLGRKKKFSSLKFIFLKNLNGTFMNIWKHFFKNKILCLKKPLTLGAWNRQFSFKRGGDFIQLCVLKACEAIFRGRDLIFCVEPHIRIYLTNIKSFLDWTTWSLLKDVQLYFFSAFTSYSRAGHPGRLQVVQIKKK